MRSGALTVEHHGDPGTLTGVPVIDGYGFNEKWTYYCRWSHADLSNPQDLKAVWVDAEHVRCATFPGQSFSADGLDEQHKEDGDPWLIRIQLLVRVEPGEFALLPYHDGSDGPEVRYD